MRKHVPFLLGEKLDAETHRASFRAHSKHEKLFLKASGILGPFFIQKICRSDEQKTLRAQETVVQWLPKRSYAEALALVHSFESHIGLFFLAMETTEFVSLQLMLRKHERHLRLVIQDLLTPIAT